MSSSTATVTKNKKNWFMQFIYSSIGRKILMALTGLFLIMFLAVHLIGNLQLLLPDGGLAFNAYAHFMGHNEIVQIISKGNFFFIVLHIIVSIVLTRANASARPTSYAYSKPGANSTWSSRNMMILGSLVFIFLAVHLVNFYGASKFTTLGVDEAGNENLYMVVKEAFAQSWLVALYVLGMVALGFHLSHGFWSAFQTLGLNHVKYTPVIKFVGQVFCILVPALFALIPIWMYVAQL
ncbi:MAG: succinate dehydrogenase cytochrome b subunit [Microscillaceae bacterium]|nr:succinate dehydrogenase cytochrome b subunit [Microscillaceae bacterium]